MDQLAQLAQVQFANTPQGLVTVTVDPYTGQGRAASAPMDPPTFARMLYQRASVAARQALAKASAEASVEVAKQGAMGAREAMVEQIKGDNRAREILMQNEATVQQELFKYRLSMNQIDKVQTYGMNSDQVLVTMKGGGVLLLNPGETMPNGLKTSPSLVPVQ
jgi:hypothetical protein